VHVAQTRVPLSGASDHLVSEAIYLDDPEGNGIEVYRDRCREEWRWNGDRIQMATDRLDLDNLAADAGNTATRARRTACASATSICASAISRRRSNSIATSSASIRPRARRRAVHVIGPLSSSRRQQHLALGRRRTARRDRAGLAWFAIEARISANASAHGALKAANVPLGEFRTGSEARDPFGTRVRFA
jgi:catechol 2,3-dioxygenase